MVDSNVTAQVPLIPGFIPGLPDDLAIICLARVPSLSSLRGVCQSWQSLLSHSRILHSLRAALGFKPQLWLYVLLYEEGLKVSPSEISRCAFSWHAYDPIADRWHRLPPFPKPLDFQLTSPSFIGRLHSVQCASSQDKLFMVAGSRRKVCSPSRGGSPQVAQSLDPDSTDRQPLKPALECPLIFDTRTCTWTNGTPFRVPRKWCVCGTASGKLIVASGCGKDWDFSVSKLAEMYDPDKETWITLEHLKSSKFSGEAISAVNCNGKLHMVSGKGVFWKVGVVYDPQTGRWTDMPRGMCNGWNGQCVAVDGNLFVLEDCTGKLKMYCKSEDNWNTVIREDMLKNMEQLTQAGPRKFCGIVRAPCSSTSHCQDVVQIVDIRDPATINVLRPPFGQIVTVQVLSRTWLS